MSTESFQEMKYKAPDRRVFSAVAPPSSVARPNYHDALRRGELALRERERESGKIAGSPVEMEVVEVSPAVVLMWLAAQAVGGFIPGPPNSGSTDRCRVSGGKSVFF